MSKLYEENKHNIKYYPQAAAPTWNILFSIHNNAPSCFLPWSQQKTSKDNEMLLCAIANIKSVQEMCKYRCRFFKCNLDPQSTFFKVYLRILIPYFQCFSYCTRVLASP